MTDLFEPAAGEVIVADPVTDSVSPLTRLVNIVKFESLTIFDPSYARVPLKLIFLFVTSKVNVPPVRV